MIRGILPSGLLALALVLTGLAATIAETRMAAAGEYCGTGSPELLLDASGLPILDKAGTAIAAPDCLTCHLVKTLAIFGTASASKAIPLASIAPVVAAPTSLCSGVWSRAQARAPPRMVHF